MYFIRMVGAAIGTNAEKTIVYKYYQNSNSWIELVKGMKSTSGKGSVVHSKNNKKIENVYEAPFSLKEGDLLCGFEWPPVESTVLMNIETMKDSPIGMIEGSIEGIKEVGVVGKSTTPHSEIPKSIPHPSLTKLNKPIISRPEDKYIQDMREEVKLLKKGVKFTGKKQAISREIVLSLGGNLDFSDDENEE